MNISVWSGALLEKLKELNDKAMSSSQIASEINSLFGCQFSRSAIIGARHRQGLTIPEKSTWTLEQRLAYGGGGYRRTTGEKKPRVRSGPSQRGKWQRIRVVAAADEYKDAPSIEDMEIPLEQRKTLLQLDSNTCHWPVGDPQNRNFFFCGGEALPEKPYCAGHCRVAYFKGREPNPKAFKFPRMGMSVGAF